MIKLKLLGYYQTERQTMQPEEFRIDEANELAEKFKVSFADVKDADLADILNSNAVMIFRDSQHKLYAYFQSQKIARVTEVIYNPKNINKPQRKFAGWFTPGEPFVISDEDDKDRDQSIKIADLADNLVEYKRSDFKISTYGGDFLIHLGHKTYALDWGDVRISISNLSRLISHRWTYMSEYDTDENCAGCDGYNYDNCDMFRCKNNCERCGGRSYVCNNSCFNYRNDTAVLIRLLRRASEELSQAIDIMDCISKPFSIDSEILEQQYHSMLESICKDCSFITDYIRYDILIDYMRRYNQMNRLLECRGSDSAEVKKTKLTIGTTKYLLKSSDLKVEVEGWIWTEYYIVIESAYDYISDSLVSIKRGWKSKDKIYRKDFMASIDSCKVSEISIFNNSLYFKK